MKGNFILPQFNNILTKRYFSTKIQTSIHVPIKSDSLITRVRVWKSGYTFEPHSPETFVSTNVIKSFLSHKKKGARANIGHVSVETHEIYSSLWPEEFSYDNKYKPQPGQANNSTPAKDENAENRSPDYVIDLYTLDVDNINKKFYEYLETGAAYRYHIIGSNYFFNHYGANSCCGLAYDLLVSGGIKKLIPTNQFIRDYIITTPNNLAQLVLEAHSNEQAMLNSVKPLNIV